MKKEKYFVGRTRQQIKDKSANEEKKNKKETENAKQKINKTINKKIYTKNKSGFLKYNT